MHTNLRPHLALAALLALISAPARADVVRSEPENCPDGSFGNTSHCGPYCEALTCTTDRDCTAGRTCQPVKACTHTYECFDPAPTVHGGSCSNATCTDAKDTCQSVKLCILNENPTTDDSGSSGTNPGATTGTPGTTTSPTTDPNPTSAGPTTTSSDSTTNNATGSTGAATSTTDGGTGDKGCACTLTDDPGEPRAALALLLLAALPRRRKSRR
jgi:MYXO-CTERM domain-containing protein